MMQNFAHYRGADKEVYAVSRHDPTSGKIEQFNPDTGVWDYTPGLADEIVGGEPGAYEISEAVASALCASGKLAKKHPSRE